MKLVNALVLGLGAAAAPSCSANRGQAPGVPGPLAERDAADRRLRRMFPGIQGEITREAIAAELERERGSRDPAEGVRTAAVMAIEAGEFGRARDLLSELLAGAHVDRASAKLSQGDPRAALAELDLAVEMAPRSSSIACLRGEAALEVARLEREPELTRSALASFSASAALDPDRTGPRAWLGASRAASALGRPEEASEYARRGLESLRAGSAIPDRDVHATRRRAEELQRALAQARYDEVVVAKRSGASVEAIAERTRASRAALEGLVGRAPEDARGWERLAELAQADGRVEEARDLARRGLRISPEDRGLLERLGLAARALGGPGAALAELEAFARDHPDLAFGSRQLGLTLLDAAAELAAGDAGDPRDRLKSAEAAFARCRELDATQSVECRALEAECRGVLGFWLLSRLDLPGAHQAFLSMEDARKGGLSQVVRGSGRRGTDGLLAVAERYGERSDPGRPGSIDDLEQAARICDLLHEVDPADARFAAASGRFNRDSAIALELKATTFAGRGQGEEAERLLGRAREQMETAFAAWRDAASLAPEDERALAEAGAVLARYLQRDADVARVLLEKAVSLGERRIPVLLAAAEEKGIPGTDRAARRQLLEDEQSLVGDACRDLGLVHLELLGDPAQARDWLERSRGAGPDPRPEIDGLLERCAEARAGTLDPRLRDQDRWAAPPATKTH